MSRELRASRYNLEVEDGDRCLVFNTATGAFASLGERVRRALAEHVGSAVSELVEAGFLTMETAADELGAQEEVHRASCGDASEFALTIAPTYACNCRCPYCYEDLGRIPAASMTDRVMDAICDHIERSYAREPFRRMRIEWFGGEPTLALGTIEELSGFFLDFCEAHGVAYEAVVLSNCTMVNAAAARLLSDCGVKRVAVSFAGERELHDERRQMAGAGSAFDRCLEAVRVLLACGIDVYCGYSVDKRSCGQFRSLRAYLRSEFGLDLHPAQLQDHAHLFGTGKFLAPAYDLMTRREYLQWTFELLEEDGVDASSMASLLAATPRYCRGQTGGYAVIDALGDVYKCDNLMGVAEHRRANVLDPGWAGKIGEPTLDPYRLERCRACSVLPLCQGNCLWQHQTGMGCHPLKLMPASYLRLYVRCFEPDGSEFQRFA